MGQPPVEHFRLRPCDGGFVVVPTAARAGALTHQLTAALPRGLQTVLPGPVPVASFAPPICRRYRHIGSKPRRYPPNQ
jgi:hypothetical protein